MLPKCGLVLPPFNICAVPPLGHALGILAEAEKAAFLKDIKAHVAAKHVDRAVSLWDESRVLHPTALVHP